MTTVTLELPEDVYATLRRSPEEFARELRLAALDDLAAPGVP